MKKIGFLLILLISFKANAQLFNYEAWDTYEFSESWYINSGAGTTIFLGDIAPQPKLTLKKNMNQYKLGYMFRLGKRIIPGLDLNLECIKGKMGGNKEFDAIGSLMDQSFSGDFWGLTFNARLDILKFFSYTRGLPVSFFLRFGAGPLYYRSVKTHLSTGAYWSSMGMSADGQTKEKRAQAAVAPCGIGIFYNISDNFRVEVDVDLFNSSTEYLDSHHGQTSTCNDKFVMANFALQYNFDLRNKLRAKFKNL